MVDDLVRGMQARSTELRGLNARVRFVLGGPGETILVDARSTPVAVTRADGEADCTLRLSPENLAKLMDGRLNPMLAYSMGKLKVEGSPGVAMKLASLLDG
ncbi:SCP2 sterol-binding domain-containing protein [Azospirillum sp. ST 5-10]|uniref:SCP2 sterol-binding domain-containing protein n=1 Tax=unclassified Azospirillum TaxID=2630922 RepID=UPI003F4A13EA